jgi:hypothetical protein
MGARPKLTTLFIWDANSSTLNGRAVMINAMTQRDRNGDAIGGM